MAKDLFVGIDIEPFPEDIDDLVRNLLFYIMEYSQAIIGGPHPCVEIHTTLQQEDFRLRITAFSEKFCEYNLFVRFCANEEGNYSNSDEVICLKSGKRIVPTVDNGDTAY